MRHVLSAVVQNVPGVLSHISGMLASRGYNIDSLAVGETENPHLSRMTFVVVGDDRVLEQVRKQLEKIVTVVQVDDISAQDHVERDLMLLKVHAEPGGTRSEIRELVNIFRGRIVDDEDQPISAGLCSQEKKTIIFYRVGVIDQDYRKKGAQSAVYYFLVRYAKDQNFDKIDLTLSRFLLRDGVYLSKREWGARTN